MNTNTHRENQEFPRDNLWKTKAQLNSLQKTIKQRLIAALLGLSLSWGFSSCEDEKPNTLTQEKIEQTTPKKELSISELKKKPIDLGYSEINKEHKIHFINFPKLSQEDLIKCKLSKAEKILRCLRWKSITDAAEDKYKLPRWLLMAMMAQEWVGDPTLPNILKRKTNPETKKIEISESDWGLGLIHIQGANAEDFGLKVLQVNPNSKNSRKMKDTELWKKVIEKFNKTKDLKELSKYDDRRHPILAIDCAARFLKSKYNPKDWKDARILALNRYSGRKRTDYATKVLEYRVTIDKYSNEGTIKNIPEFTEGVQKVIERENKSQSYERFNTLIKDIEVEINWEKGGYQLYLDYNKQQCANYWLQEYINQ